MAPLRIFAVLFFALAAGCGDDTTSSTMPPDMTCQCCYTSGDACPTAGAHCSSFEYHCLCGSDGKWSCHGISFPPDMAHPLTD
jgi:hypothetical protein